MPRVTQVDTQSTITNRAFMDKEISIALKSQDEYFSRDEVMWVKRDAPLSSDLHGALSKLRAQAQELDNARATKIASRAGKIGLQIVKETQRV
mmetsp:Transcript_40081/g.55695  ORF Transcript_40081/g.55695 Transcript_40081/m.55695 type:complete len:93 (-) Transcript_40081:306-584(-)